MYRLDDFRFTLSVLIYTLQLNRVERLHCLYNPDRDLLKNNGLNPPLMSRIKFLRFTRHIEFNSHNRDRHTE